MPAPVPPPKEWHNWNPPSCHGLSTVEGGERNRRCLKMHQQKNPVWCRQIPVKCETIVMKSPGKAMMTFCSMVLFSRSNAPFFLPVVPKKHLCHPAWRDSPTMRCQNYNFLAPQRSMCERHNTKMHPFFLWGAVQLQHLELLNRMWGHHLLDQKIAYQRITTQKANMTVECNIPGESEDLCLGFYGLTILDPYQAHPDFFRKLLMNKLPKFSYTTCDPHVGVEMWGQECNNPQTRSQLPWRQSHPSASLRTTSRTESILGST